jgi:hypothetical protein
MSIYEGEIEQLVEFVEKGARVVVPTTTTTLACDVEQWENMGCPKVLANEQMKVLELHKKMGILQTYTCTPYLIGYVPPKGSYIVATESSAVVYFNSMFGVKTNRCGLFARFASLVGKYPYMEYMMNEKRKGTHLFRVGLDEKDLNNELSWSLLGFVIGKIVGTEVPVIELQMSRYTQEQLISFGAALATAGGVTLYHIPGITPEANTVEEAFHFGDIPQPIVIKKEALIQTQEQLSRVSEPVIDFVTLGCPHYNLSQIERVARLLEGKRVSKDVNLWVCTNRMTKRAAEWEGFVDIIEKAGGLVVCDTCPVESHMRETVCKKYGLKVPQLKRMMTDSTKMAHYVRELIGCEVILDDMEHCIRGAIKGEWDETH